MVTADGDLADTPWRAWSAAVDSWVDGADAYGHVHATYVAHGKRDPEWESQWRAHVQDHDDSFPGAGDDRLLQILAGAALVSARAAGSTSAHYSIVCAQHLGWTPVLPDVRVSDEELREHDISVRKPPPWTKTKVQVTAASFESAVPSAEAAVTSDTLSEALQALAKGTTEAFDQLHTAVGRAVMAREAPLREEASLLRWLLSGYCQTLELPWAALDPSTAAVAAAVDLNELTQFSAGLPQAPLLLRTALNIATGHESQRLSLPASRLHDELMPLTVALTNGPGSTAENLLSTIAPEDIAIRLYHELRLASMLEASP